MTIGLKFTTGRVFHILFKKKIGHVEYSYLNLMHSLYESCSYVKIRTKLSLRKNTKKSSKKKKKPAEIVHAYMIEKHQRSNFENFDTVRLNEILGHFVWTCESHMGKSRT